MKDWAIINSATNIVENVAHWDGEAPWTPPEGTFVQLLDGKAGIGWKWNGTSFEAPLEPVKSAPQMSMDQIVEQMAALQAQVQKLSVSSSNSATGQFTDPNPPPPAATNP